jgi:hypothetical protein
MSYEKHTLLIDRLVQKTIDGEIEWRASLQDDAFQVSFGTNTLRIREVRRNDVGDSDYFIDLINADGATVETIYDVELDNNPNTLKTSQIPLPWYTKLKLLLESARRSALGSDKLLDDILSKLK